MNIKKMLEESVLEEIDLKMASYKQKIKAIQEEDSIPKLYESLVDIYNNKPQKSEVAMRFLSEALTSDFFKKSNLVRISNEVRFYSEDIFISFPLARDKRIKLVAFNVEKGPWFTYINMNPKIELANKIENFLANKTLSNFKEVVKYNSDCQDNKKSFISKARNSYKLCNQETLKKLRAQVLNYNKKRNDYLEKLASKNLELEKINAIVNSLPELEEWQNAGWTIVFKVNEQNSYSTIIDFNSEHKELFPETF